MTTMLGCPKCGGTNLKAWYIEPVSYPITVLVSDDDGEPEIRRFGEPTIGEGGDLDEIWCQACGEPVATDTGELVPVAEIHPHAAAALTGLPMLCHDDDGKGVCSECSVGMEVCPGCDGVGYHRARCELSDEGVAS